MKIFSSLYLAKQIEAFARKNKKKGLELVDDANRKEVKLCGDIWLCSSHIHILSCLIWQGHSPYRPVNPVAARGQKRVLIGLSAHRDTLGEIPAGLSPQREYFSPDWLWSLNGWTLACWWPDVSQSTSLYPDGWQDCDDASDSGHVSTSLLCGLVLREKHLQME